MHSITLMGLKYAGKTSLAEYMASHFSISFQDIDSLILQHCAHENKYLFEDIGSCYQILDEKAFRDVESQVIDNMDFSQQIISAGGGIVLQGETMHRIKANSLCVYLMLSYDSFVERATIQKQSIVHSDLKQYYQKRTPLYEHYADVTISAEQDISEMAKEIQRIMQDGK